MDKEKGTKVTDSEAAYELKILESNFFLVTNEKVLHLSLTQPSCHGGADVSFW